MNDKCFAAENKILTNEAFSPFDFGNEYVPHHFEMKTLYPGLVTGLGNVHESGDYTNEITLGFSFDYVSGLPYIPASTVKGTLRSPFIWYPDYITEILRNICVNREDINIKMLEYEVFGDFHNKDKSDRPETKDKNRGIDTFFDAVPIRVENSDKLLLGLDNITPHINKKHRELDGLTEPVPLKMLKVMPGVVFEFRFALIDGIITAKEKQDLFKQVISDLGIGAKTDVGFGVMLEGKPQSQCDNAGISSPVKVEAAVSASAGSKCKNCGKDTGFDKKNKLYYDYCNPCNEKRKRP